MLGGFAALLALRGIPGDGRRQEWLAEGHDLPCCMECTTGRCHTNCKAKHRVPDWMMSSRGASFFQPLCAESHMLPCSFRTSNRSQRPSPGAHEPSKKKTAILTWSPRPAQTAARRALDARWHRGEGSESQSITKKTGSRSRKAGSLHCPHPSFGDPRNRQVSNEGPVPRGNLSSIFVANLELHRTSPL